MEKTVTVTLSEIYDIGNSELEFNRKLISKGLQHTIVNGKIIFYGRVVRQYDILAESWKITQYIEKQIDNE